MNPRNGIVGNGSWSALNATSEVYHHGLSSASIMDKENGGVASEDLNFRTCMKRYEGFHIGRNARCVGKFGIMEHENRSTIVRFEHKNRCGGIGVGV